MWKVGKILKFVKKEEIWGKKLEIWKEDLKIWKELEIWKKIGNLEKILEILTIFNTNNICFGYLALTCFFETFPGGMGYELQYPFLIPTNIDKHLLLRNLPPT